ncbi:hypothetical protein NSQ62_08385 [Solibacillus sp. FSL H8-0523]|uniref:hypothetical protein n=1 Tax=Solibacillus sp. FSL H8-0523 TaxID=2954511 RepID=UPI003100FC52
MKIALVAEAGGGKDFLAEHLISAYGFTRYAFADEVRKVAALYFPQQFGGNQSKNRSLLQSIGTKFREIDEDVWINILMLKIQREIELRRRSNYSMGLFVVTDCRMTNEYQALIDDGFIFIRIHTNKEVRLKRLIERGDKFTENDLNHYTESFISQFQCQYEMQNDNSKEAAIAALDTIMADIRGKI